MVICALTLISCGEGELGAWKDKYDYEKEVREEIELHMYIIVGEGTTSNAITTVQNMINQYTESNFKTTLTVHYLTASEYEDTLKEHLAADKKGEKVGNADAQVDILLVTNEALMNELMDGSYLADLTEFYDSDTYGTINTNIAESLLDAARVDGKLYCVPNNHVVGNYEYLVINKTMAEELNYGPLTLASYTTYEATAALRADMASKKGLSQNEIDANVYVKSDGMYEDKAEIEASGEWICNIVSKPVATAAEVYSSAFAISSTTEYSERCFEIIFALNMQAEFRNLLQYGVNITNYTIDEDGVVTRKLDDENNAYNMNLLYTGTVFKAYYCEELGWTEAAKTNGEAQNANSRAE